MTMQPGGEVPRPQHIIVFEEDRAPGIRFQVTVTSDVAPAVIPPGLGADIARLVHAACYEPATV